MYTLNNLVTVTVTVTEVFVLRFLLVDEGRIIKQIKSNLFAISLVHNITIHKFALRLAGQTGDNFALMSAHDN